jgi:hypothetical protein
VRYDVIRSRKPQTFFFADKFYLIQPVGTVSKCTKDDENVYAFLVMVSILGRKETLVDKTVYQNGSFDTSFDPPLFSLDSIFNSFGRFFFTGTMK